MTEEEFEREIPEELSIVFKRESLKREEDRKRRRPSFKPIDYPLDRKYWNIEWYDKNKDGSQGEYHSAVVKGTAVDALMLCAYNNEIEKYCTGNHTGDYSCEEIKHNTVDLESLRSQLTATIVIDKNTDEIVISTISMESNGLNIGDGIHVHFNGENYIMIFIPLDLDTIHKKYKSTTMDTLKYSVEQDALSFYKSLYEDKEYDDE